jgi:hypothetical protein
MKKNIIITSFLSAIGMTCFYVSYYLNSISHPGLIGNYGFEIIWFFLIGLLFIAVSIWFWIAIVLKKNFSPLLTTGLVILIGLFIVLLDGLMR